MISISADWLREYWAEIISGSGMEATFSVWDDDEVFTLTEIGRMSSNNLAEGIVMAGSDNPENTQVIVRLVPIETFPESSDGSTFEAPNGELYVAVGEVMMLSDTASHEVRIFEIASELASRRSPILETDILSDSAVLVVGLGTGGAYVAVELAKCGVGKFILVDADRLDIGNVSRHSAGVSQVGRAKVHVVRDLILEANPYAQVETYPISVEHGNEDAISELIDRVDIVVCATDSRASKLRINHLCVTSARVAVYGGAFRRAYGGQVLRVRPGESPCFQCFVLAMPEQEADREVSSIEEAELLAYSDMPVAPEPGLSLDVAPIAHMTTKLALQELLIGKESELHVLDADFAAPWYFWINRPETDSQYQDLPPLSDASDEITIMRWYGVYLARELGCPECGEFESNARQEYDLSEGELPAIKARSLPAGLDHGDEEI